jgi:hypothetical protein
MKTKTVLGVLVVFLAAVLAQEAYAGTYWYQGQAIYSDPVISRYSNSYYGNSYYGNSYAGGNYYGGQYQERYYNDGFPQVPYQPTGFYYNVKPYAEGFPDYYYYDYPESYNIGMGRSYNVYETQKVRDFYGNTWRNTDGNIYTDNRIDYSYYYYPQDGQYFDRYGRNYYN